MASDAEKEKAARKAYLKKMNEEREGQARREQETKKKIEEQTKLLVQRHCTGKDNAPTEEQVAAHVKARLEKEHADREKVIAQKLAAQKAAQTSLEQNEYYQALKATKSVFSGSITDLIKSVESLFSGDAHKKEVDAQIWALNQEMANLLTGVEHEKVKDYASRKLKELKPTDSGLDAARNEVKKGAQAVKDQAKHYPKLIELAKFMIAAAKGQADYDIATLAKDTFGVNLDGKGSFIFRAVAPAGSEKAFRDIAGIEFNTDNFQKAADELLGFIYQHASEIQ